MGQISQIGLGIVFPLRTFAYFAVQSDAIWKPQWAQRNAKEGESICFGLNFLGGLGVLCGYLLPLLLQSKIENPKLIDLLRLVLRVCAPTEKRDPGSS
jgi:hypothetical protein